MKTSSCALKMIVIILMIQPLVATSQKLGSEGVRINDFRDTEGSLIKSGGEMGVVGTSMLIDGWATGIIKFRTGKTFTDTALNYSLYTNKLYLKREGRYLELVQPAETFSLSFQSENGAIVNHQFKSGYPIIDDRNENSYYEVYFEGNHIQLLGWLQKKVVEPLTYGGPVEKTYSLEQRLYIYNASEKKMIPIRSYSPDGLKKLIPAYTANIDSYCSSHKIGSKKREQFVGLLSFLDAN